MSRWLLNLNIEVKTPSSGAPSKTVAASKGVDWKLICLSRALLRKQLGCPSGGEHGRYR
jgi:hypothetical protein